MSVRFSGWRVEDSEYSVHHGELKMNKKPRRRGIYTMYHGTTVANARLIIPNGFQRSKVGLLGEGVYVTRDVLKACNYPRNSALSDRVVLKLRVRLGKCKEIRDDKDPLLTTWSKNGFDSAWVPPDAKMASVPSGLQENCVFDPRRVEVVGIARAHTSAIEKDLVKLLDKKPEDRGDRKVCSLCRRRTHRDVPHVVQGCWACHQDICILMIEHKCGAKPTQNKPEEKLRPLQSSWLCSRKNSCFSRMSLRFSGWVVIYDEDQPSGQLGATQKPRNCGIYTMYHGTSVASARLIIANGFKQSQGGMLGKGVYVSRDQTKAERYPLNNPASDRVVLELLVRVGRVKRINKDNHPLQYTWNEEGYDTAWVPPNCGMKAVPSGLEEDCVFDPKNIKVVAIAKAPAAVLQELQQLVATHLRDPAADGTIHVCPLCMREVRAGSHVTQACWSCNQDICIFMPQHVCRRV
eukprot:XP_011614382.1 PREDICTED: uncharacterized protein LOC101080231 [Takifugu rubripes]